MAKYLPGSFSEQSEKGRLDAYRRELNLREKQQGIDSYKAKSDRISSSAYSLQTNMGLWNVMKPLLIGALILFFILGPGLSAVMQIFGQFDWWIWAIGILVALVVWRNWR